MVEKKIEDTLEAVTGALVILIFSVMPIFGTGVNVPTILFRILAGLFGILTPLALIGYGIQREEINFSALLVFLANLTFLLTAGITIGGTSGMYMIQSIINLIFGVTMIAQSMDYLEEMEVKY